MFIFTVLTILSIELEGTADINKTQNSTFSQFEYFEEFRVQEKKKVLRVLTEGLGCLTEGYPIMFVIVYAFYSEKQTQIEEKKIPRYLAIK
jgi:hypothetical protein